MNLDRDTILHLRARVASGRYEVDPRAVAEAMIRRTRGSRSSRVLVAPELLGRLTAGADELEPRSAADLA
jgi:hypothetical protein